MAAATIFTDRRESLFNEAGDYLIAAQEGAIDQNSLAAELGEVLIGQHQGRSSTDEITLFKSLGLAMEDLASAEFIYRKAREQSCGTCVDW